MFVKLWRHTRRNHALEHATINLLNQRYPDAHVVGLSDPFGFTIYTSLTAEEVVPATNQALSRLKAGETLLSLHQQCGTNLVVAAMLTTTASLIGLSHKANSESHPPSNSGLPFDFFERP